MNSKLIRVAVAFGILAAASGSFLTRGALAAESQANQGEGKIIYCEITEEDGTTSVWEVDSAEACKAMGGKIVSGSGN